MDPQLPTVTSGSPDTTVYASLSTLITVWVITDKSHDTIRLHQTAHENNFNLQRIFTLDQTDRELPNLLEEMESDPPDLIWMLAPDYKPGRALNTRGQTASRVLLKRQLEQSRHVTIEAATDKPTTHGFFVSPGWFDEFPQLQKNRLWWCALAIGNKDLSELKKCIYSHTVSSFPLPSRYLSCCGRVNKQRGIRPKHVSTTYLLPVLKVLREALRPTSAELKPLQNLSTESAFPTNSKERSKTRTKAQGAKTITEDDGPGEHEANFVPLQPKKKEIENTYDDCGDDVSKLLLDDDISVQANFVQDSTSVPYDVFTTWDMETTYDSEFMNWSLQGSTAENDDYRPSANYVSNFYTAYEVMNQQHSSGAHDIVEIFGGKAGVTKIAIRYKLSTGPNFDLVSNIDLTDPEEVKMFWRYMYRHRPRVVVAGPPCTALGGWSHYNRIHHPEKWQETYVIGKALGLFVAQVAKFQLDHRRHFVIENPISSDLWSFPEFQALLQREGVTFVRGDQCCYGLRDPTGIPTLKPTGFLCSSPILAKRLSRRCDNSHTHVPLAGKVNGVSRCKFAQVWPDALCQAVVQGILEVLNHDNMYMVIAADLSQDLTYAFPANTEGKCPGCSCHARRDDPRHNRKEGVCRFPLDRSLHWKCPACMKFLPSTHGNHLLNDTCQWSDIQRRVGMGMREPKPKPTEPALQEPSAEPDHPPPVDRMKWKPVTDIEIITKLQTLSSGTQGWVLLDSNTVSVDVPNARIIRGPEPRYSLSIYNKRSSFGYFPELPHEHGVWWQLENQTELLTNQAKDIGFRVPLLIIFFHKADTSTKNNTRKGPLQNSLDASTSSAPAAVPSSSSTSRVRHLDDIPEEPAIAEPIGDGEEPAIPIQQLGQEPLGEADMPNQDPEWSSYDLGRALRALRSGNAGLQAHTLKRLHLRWWHCTATRMAALLKAANVPGEAIAMIPGIVNSCKICRLWQKPSNRSVHASRLSEKFNEAIQFDLLFVEDMIIAVAIDEATRFCMARIIPSRETEQILRFLTNDWIRIFGKPNLILSDQEGGLHSEEGAIWLERHCISGKPVPKGAHASIVERHHQTLRSTIHRLLAQCRSEGLIVSGPDIVAESVYAKNCLTSVNGYSPYEAVIGRRPNMLMDLDNPTISALDDTTGEVIGANRHATRLREVAIASVVESTAQARMKLAEQSKTRISSQSLNIQPGSLVDIYRTPSKKDLSGWRGPCQVIAVRDGTIDIKWNGRVLICRPQDVRPHLISAFLVDSDAPQFHVLQEHLRSVFNEVRTLAWVYTDKGWQLSKAAQEHPQVLRAILFIASNMFQLTRCVGARIGRGFHVLGGLSSITTCVLMWWPTERPALYQTLTHDGKQAVNLRQTIGESDGTSNDYSWAQFLGVAVPQARRIRRTAPNLPHLHPDDPNDPPWLAPPPDAPMNAPPPDDRPQPMDTDKTTLAPRDYDPIPVDSNRSNKTPPPKPPPKIPKYQRPSSPRTGPQRHPIPSTASSSHRPWKQQAKDDKPTEPMPPQQPARDDKPAKQPSPQHSDKPAQQPSPQHQVGGSSSSSGPTTNVPLNIPAHVPILPISGQDDADEHTDSDATHGWADEIDREDFLCVVSRDGQIMLSYFDKAEDIESSMPKAPGDLTPTEITQHWTEVAAAVRKELKSFIDLDVWEIRKKGSCGNRMTAKMLLKWKLDPVSLQRLCKARLTVRGFQDKDRHTQTFASTATRWGQRIIVMLAVQQQWSLVTADIGSAFLRGLTFEQLAQLTGEPLRQCAFEFPKDYLEFLWELDGHNNFDPNLHELFMLKPVYGLQDAPRAWRKRLHIALISTHGRPLATDACIYVWYRLQNDEQKLRGALSTHVDDLKICGPDEFIIWLITFLEKEFGKLKVQRGRFEHCGLIHETQEDGAIVVHQNHYAQRLKNIDLTSLPLDQPTQLCQPLQVEQFMSGIGSLAWMSQTRLDVLVHIQSLQRASKNPTIGHLVRLNIVIKWVRRKPLHIKYVRLLTASLKTLVINDAAFRREDASGLAMRGSVIALAEDGPEVGGRLMLVDYYSKRQRKVVRSTFGAETHAAADGTEIGKLVAYTFAEIMTPGITAAGILRLEAEGRLLTPLHIITDCKSLYDALRMDEIQVPSESSLIMVLLQLKEGLRSGSIKAITWCDTRDMCADGLNKGIIARKGLRDLATSGFWKLEHNSATHTETSRVSIAAEVIDSPELVQARSHLAAHVY